VTIVLRCPWTPSVANAIRSLIFPPNQLVTQELAYSHGVSGYRNFYEAPEALTAAQHAAISSWASEAVAAR
jgi:hypothetical protein